MTRSGTIRFHLLLRVEWRRNRSGRRLRPRYARPKARSKRDFQRLISQKRCLQNRLNFFCEVLLTTPRDRESFIEIHRLWAEISHLLGTKIPRYSLLIGRSAHSLKTLERSRRSYGGLLAREASTKLVVCSGNSFIFFILKHPARVSGSEPGFPGLWRHSDVRYPVQKVTSSEIDFDAISMRFRRFLDGRFFTIIMVGT